MKAITPNEVYKKKQEQIPPQVIEAFNELIVKKWSGSSAHVKQNEAIAAIQAKLPHLTRHDIFDNHMLDVEGIFYDAGWEVKYDKPGYCEEYEASFTFRKGK